MWTLIKTAVFTIIFPGTVGGFVPYLVTRDGPRQSPAMLVWFAAVLLVAFGLTLYLSSAWRFAVDGLGTPSPVDPPRALVVRGPYRFTRNPMYVAVASVIASETLITGSLTLAIYGASVFACFFLFVVLYEEPVLRTKFGPSYDSYRAAVPRWIPSVTSWR